MFYLSGIGLAKTDDPNPAGDVREAQHMQPRIEETKGHESPFRIGFADVLVEQRRLEIKLGDPIERQAPVSNVAPIFGRIVINPHRFNCNNEKIVIQVFCLLSTSNAMEFKASFDPRVLRAHPVGPA